MMQCAFEKAWDEAMASEVGFKDYVKGESKYNQRYTAEQHRRWQSMTPEQQEEWDREIRIKVYQDWFVGHNRERFIPEDYKQWLGQSLPGLRPCRYFARAT